ncbi:hypothetical protein TWF281_003106 [Arthrobotrys megalospora]
MPIDCAVPLCDSNVNIQTRDLSPSAIALPSGPSSIFSDQIPGLDLQLQIPITDLNTDFSDVTPSLLSALQHNIIETAPLRSPSPNDDLPALQSTRSTFSSLDTELKFPTMKNLAITNQLPESRPVTPFLFPDVVEEPVDLQKSHEVDFATFQLPESRSQTPELVHLPLPAYHQLHSLPISRPSTPIPGYGTPKPEVPSIILENAAPAGQFNLMVPSPTLMGPKSVETSQLDRAESEGAAFVFPGLPQSLVSSPRLSVQTREGSLLERYDHTSLYSPILHPEYQPSLLEYQLPITSSHVAPKSAKSRAVENTLLDAGIYDLPDSLPASPKSVQIKLGVNKDQWADFPGSDIHSAYEVLMHVPGATSVPSGIDLGPAISQHSAIPVNGEPGPSLPSSRRSSLVFPIDTIQRVPYLDNLPVLPHSRAQSVLSVSLVGLGEVLPDIEVSASPIERGIGFQFPVPATEGAEIHQIFETTEVPANDVAVPYAASAELGSAGLPGSARALSLEPEPIANEVQSSSILAEGIVLPHSPAGTSHLHFTPGKIDIFSYCLPSASFADSRSEFNAPSDAGTLKAPSTIADCFALPPDAADSVLSFGPIEQPITSHPGLPLSEFSAPLVDDSDDVESVKSKSAFFQDWLPDSTPSSPKLDSGLDVLPLVFPHSVSKYSLWDVTSGLELPKSRGFSTREPTIVALPNLPPSLASSIRLGALGSPIQACPSLPGTWRDDEEFQPPVVEDIEIAASIIWPETVSLPLSDMESEFSLSAIRPKDVGHHALPYSRPPTPVSFEEVEGPAAQRPEPSEYMLGLPISPRSVTPLVDVGFGAAHHGILPPSHQASPLLLPAQLEPMAVILPQVEAQKPETRPQLPEIHVDPLPGLPASPSLRSFKLYSLEERAEVELPISEPASRAASLVAQDPVDETLALETDKPKVLEPIVPPNLPDSPTSFYLPAGDITLEWENTDGASQELPISYKASPLAAPVAIEAPTSYQKAISLLELEREAPHMHEEHQFARVYEYPMLPASPPSVYDVVWGQLGSVRYPQLPSSRPISPTPRFISEALLEALCDVPEITGSLTGRGAECEEAIESPNFAATCTLPKSPISSSVTDICGFEAISHVAGLPASFISEHLLHEDFLAAPIDSTLDVAIQNGLPASEPASPRLPYPQVYRQPALPPSRPPTLMEVPRVEDVVESADLRSTPHHNFELLGANRIGEAIALPESIPPLSAILDDNRDRLSCIIPSSHPASVYEASSRIDDFQLFDLPRDVKLPHSVASSPASSVVFATHLAGEESLGLPLSRAATERAEEMLPSPTALPKLSTENYDLRESDGLPQDYAAVELPPSEASWKPIQTSRDLPLLVEVASQYTSIDEARPAQITVPTQAPEALPESPALPPSLSGIGVSRAPPDFFALPPWSVSTADSVVEAPISNFTPEAILPEHDHALPRSPVSSVFNFDDHTGHSEIALPDTALTAFSIGATGAIVDHDDGSDAADTVVPLPASPRTAPSLFSILYTSADPGLPQSPIDSHYTLELGDGAEVVSSIFVGASRPESGEVHLSRSLIPVTLPQSYLSSSGSTRNLDYAEGCQLPPSRPESVFDTQISSVPVLLGNEYASGQNIDAVLPDSPCSRSFVWPTGSDAADATFSLPQSRAMSQSSIREIQEIEARPVAPVMSDMLRNDLPSLPSTLPPTPVAQEFAGSWESRLLPHSHLESPLDSPCVTPLVTPLLLPAIAVTLPPVPRSPSIRNLERTIAVDSPQDLHLPLSVLGSPYVSKVMGLDVESIASLQRADKASIVDRVPVSSSVIVAVPVENVPLPGSPIQRSSSPLSSLRENFYADVETLPYSHPASPCAVPAESPIYSYKPHISEPSVQRIPLHQVITSYPISADEAGKETLTVQAVAGSSVHDFLIPDSPRSSPKVVPESAEIDVHGFLVQSPIALPTQGALPRDIDVTEYLLDSDPVVAHNERLGSPRFSSGLAQFEDSFSDQEFAEHSVSLGGPREPLINEELPGTYLENVLSVPKLPSTDSSDAFSEAASRGFEMPLAVEEAVPALSLSSPQEAMESFETSSIASTSDPRNWLGYTDLPELPSSPLFEPAAKPERPWNESVYEPPKLQEMQWPIQDRSPLISSVSPHTWGSTEHDELVDGEPENQFVHPRDTVPAPRPSRGLTIVFPEYESETEGTSTNIIDELLPPSSPPPRETFSPSDVGIIDELLPQFGSPSVRNANKSRRRGSETSKITESRGSTELYDFQHPSSPYLEPVVEFTPISPAYREISPTHKTQPPPLDTCLAADSHATASSSSSPVVTKAVPEISHIGLPSSAEPPQSPRSFETPSDVFTAPRRQVEFELLSPSPKLSPVQYYDDAEVLPSFEDYHLGATDLELDTYVPESPRQASIGGADTEEPRERLQFTRPDSPTARYSPKASVDRLFPLYTTEEDTLDDIARGRVLDESSSYLSPRSFATIEDSIEDSFAPMPQATQDDFPALQYENQRNLHPEPADFEDEGVESDYYSDSDSDSEIHRPTSPPESVLGPSKTVRFAEHHELREYVPDDGETSPVESDTWSVPTTAGSSKPRRIRDSMPSLESDSPILSPTHQTHPITSREFVAYPPPLSIPYIPDEGIDERDAWDTEIQSDDNEPYNKPEFPTHGFTSEPFDLSPAYLPGPPLQDDTNLGATRELPVADETISQAARRASVPISPTPLQRRTKKPPKARRRNSAVDETSKAKKTLDHHKEAKTTSPRGNFFLPPLFRSSSYQTVEKRPKKPIPALDVVLAPSTDIGPSVLETLPRDVIDVEDILSASPQKLMTNSPIDSLLDTPPRRRTSVTKSSKQKPQVAKDALPIPEPLPKPNEELALEAVPQANEEGMKHSPRPETNVTLSPAITSDSQPTKTQPVARKLSIAKPKTASPTLKDVKKPKSPVADVVPREVLLADLPDLEEAVKPISSANKTAPRRASKSETPIPKAAATPKSPVAESAPKLSSFFDIFPTTELPKLKAPIQEAAKPTVSENKPPIAKEAPKLKPVISETVLPKNLRARSEAQKEAVKSIPHVMEVLPPGPSIVASPKPSASPKETLKPSASPKEALKPSASPKEIPKPSVSPKEIPKPKAPAAETTSREVLEAKVPIYKDVPNSPLAKFTPEKTSKSKVAAEKAPERTSSAAWAALAIVPVTQVAKHILDSNPTRGRDAEEDKRVSRTLRKDVPAPRRRRSVDTIDSARELAGREERKDLKLPTSRKEQRNRRPAARSVSPQRRKPAPEPLAPLLTDPSSKRQDIIKSRDAMRVDSPKSATTPLFPAIASWFSRNDNPPELSKKAPRLPSPSKVEKPARRNTAQSPERKPRDSIQPKSHRPRSESPVKRMRVVEPLPEKLPPPRISKQRSKARSVSPLKRVPIVESLPERLPEKLPERVPETLLEKLPERLPAKLPERLTEKLPDPIARSKPRTKARSASPKPP